MNVNREFNYKFDNDNYIVTVQANSKVLTIAIEEEEKGVYWKSEFNEQLISETTSKMGSFKSLEVFTQMLICALSNENEKQ